MRLSHVLAATVSLLALAGAANAADLPTHKSPMAPPPAYAPAFSWTGAYIGAFAGGNWAKVTPHDITTGFGGDPVLNSNGLTAGGLAGYNIGFNAFVLGIEGEAGYDHKSASSGYLAGPNALRSTYDYGTAEGRLRGRIGYSFGQFLLFGAGGVTAKDLKLAYSNVNNGYSQEINHWRAGFNVGGGLEWAFAQHWIIRGEYIYDGFGSRSYAFNTLDPRGFDARSAKLTESTARAAIAYKF